MILDKYQIIELTKKELYKCDSFWDNGGNNEDSRLAKLMTSGERRAFAYKINDNYVGGFAISIRNNEKKEYGHLSYLCVRSDLRNNGIGSRLIDFAINYLKQIGINTIRLNVNKDNPSAIRFYERKGFKYLEDITPEKINMMKIF